MRWDLVCGYLSWEQAWTAEPWGEDRRQQEELLPLPLLSLHRAELQQGQLLQALGCPHPLATRKKGGLPALLAPPLPQLQLSRDPSDSCDPIGHMIMSPFSTCYLPCF